MLKSKTSSTNKNSIPNKFLYSHCHSDPNRLFVPIYCRKEIEMNDKLKPTNFLTSGFIGGCLFSGFWFWFLIVMSYNIPVPSLDTALIFPFIGLLGGYVGFWLYKNLIKSSSKLLKIIFLILSAILGLGFSILLVFGWNSL